MCGSELKIFITTINLFTHIKSETEMHRIILKSEVEKKTEIIERNEKLLFFFLLLFTFVVVIRLNFRNLCAMNLHRSIL